MDRVLARLGRTEKDNKNDGSFVFAISLIVASLTMSYKLYMYVYNNLITNLTSVIVIICFCIMSVMVVSMSLFILMKAISLEVENPRGKKKLETYATSYYLIGFIFGTFYLIFLLFSCALKVVFDIVSFLLKIPNTSNKFFLVYFAFTVFSLAYYVGFSKSFRKLLELYDEIFDAIYYEFYNSNTLKIVALLLILFVPVFYMPSNMTSIEMDDRYSNKSEQIPIDITVTGLQYDYLTVNLSKVDIKDNFKIIDSIDIKTNSDQNKVISSEYLIGNNLEFGRYKFYINSENLSEGYYELSVTTKCVFFISSSVKTKTESFYLV